MKSPIRRAIWCIILPLLTTSVWAQEQAQDTLKIELSDVAIESTRTFETTMNAARSVYVKVREGKAHEPGISLKYSLRGIPGIRISDRGHFALGEQPLVRGMGWAANDVRGAQVVLDGIPLTLADGRTMIDIVDPAFVNQAEVIRGPSSVFWGNASGGVLHLSTWAADSSALRLRYMGGSYGLSQTLASAQLRGKKETFQIYGSRLARTGYREHSSGTLVRAGARARRLIGNASVLGLVVNTSWKDVLAPGSLTRDQLMSDRRQVDSDYVSDDDGKESMDVYGGLTFETTTRLGTISATGYGISHTLEQRNYGFWSTVDRLAGGLYMQLTNRVGRLAWSMGTEVRVQRDDVNDYLSSNGQSSRNVVWDQLERVRSLAMFAAAQVELKPYWGITGGLRLDGIRFEITDPYVEDKPFTDDRSFRTVSPTIGVYYQHNALTAYANVSTSFETPTTTELIDYAEITIVDEYGPLAISGGFNQELDPMRTLGLEIGLRGQIPDRRLQIDVALFQLHTVDHILDGSYLEGYYFNSGRTRHRGLELALQWPNGAPVQMQLTYNVGQFIYLQDPSRGVHVPGLPVHHAYAAARAESNGLLFELTTEYVSDVWVDNGNEEKSSGYVVFDLYMGRTPWSLGSVVIQPFLRIQNLLNAKYSGSIIVNSVYDQYYEPAAERAFQFGLGLTL